MNLTQTQGAVRLLSLRHRLDRLEGLEDIDQARADEASVDMLATAHAMVWAEFADQCLREGIEPVRLHPIREAEFFARPIPKAVAGWSRLAQAIVPGKAMLFRLSWTDTDRFWADCPDHGEYHLGGGCADCLAALEALPIDPEVARQLRLADIRKRRFEERLALEAQIAESESFSRFMVMMDARIRQAGVEV